MKIIYIVNARIPTEKAHGIQIMKTCEAMANAGAELELWLPKRRNPAFAGRDIFDFYGVKRKFSVRWFWCLDLIGYLDFLPGAAFKIQSLTLGLSLAGALKKAAAGVVVYSRDILPLKQAQKLKMKNFYEAHTITQPMSGMVLNILKNISGIVAISQHLADEFKKYVPEERVLVGEDGVDLSAFAGKIGKKQARLSLGFPEGQKFVVYTGHLYEWKGARTLAYAAESLGAGTAVYFVGGTEADQKSFSEFLIKNRLNSAKLLGQVPHQKIPEYLAAADVLVLPNSGKFEISRSHTSPLKLFEYMASRRPIVSSDLPSIREVLDESTAIFFIPDDPLSLAKKIKMILNDPDMAERISTTAAQKVRAYSWDRRAEKILNFISHQ